jgi:hypothetical protein
MRANCPTVGRSEAVVGSSDAKAQLVSYPGAYLLGLPDSPAQPMDDGEGDEPQLGALAGELGDDASETSFSASTEESEVFESEDEEDAGDDGDNDDEL